MKKFMLLLMVVALVGVAVSSWAAGEKGKALGPVVSGTVTTLTMDNGVLKSFVLKTHAKAMDTITVTDTTKYMLGKTAATAADLKEGSKVMVRLTDAIKDNAGTAKLVRIKPAAAPKAAAPTAPAK